jgi:hypothetical protein
MMENYCNIHVHLDSRISTSRRSIVTISVVLNCEYGEPLTLSLRLFALRTLRQRRPVPPRLNTCMGPMLALN